VVAQQGLTRNELILKLLTSDHLNVPERQLLNPPAVGFAENLAVIEAALETRGSFPPRIQFTPDQVPEVGGDVTALQKLSNGNYRLYWQRAYAWDPAGTAERMTKDFNYLPAAVAEFVRSWWGSDIDGVPIVNDIEPFSPSH
jgi:hypothetical protein